MRQPSINEIHGRVILVILLTLLSIKSCSSFFEPSSITRFDFFSSTVALSAPVIPFFTKSKNRCAVVPLKFLPVGGGLAAPLLVNEAYSYFAVVDTGSPFLTAPRDAIKVTKRSRKQFPATNEQYGQDVAEILWRDGTVDIPSNPPYRKRVALGVPSENVLDDSEFVFLGLIAEDDQRPTFMKQFGFQSFSLDYRTKELLLSSGALIQDDDPAMLTLFDFSPYGPNLHHYGCVCSELRIVGERGQPSRTIQAKRPIIAVFDSGLTGCVFSDSLRDEIEEVDINGAEVVLESVSGKPLHFRSDPRYWFFTSFKLPWFDDDETHPHVVAMGTSFLLNRRMTVDCLQGRATIV